LLGDAQECRSPLVLLWQGLGDLLYLLHPFEQVPYAFVLDSDGYAFDYAL